MLIARRPSRLAGGVTGPGALVTRVLVPMGPRLGVTRGPDPGGAPGSAMDARSGLFLGAQGLPGGLASRARAAWCGLSCLSRPRRAEGCHPPGTPSPAPVARTMPNGRHSPGGDPQACRSGPAYSLSRLRFPGTLPGAGGRMIAHNRAQSTPQEPPLFRCMHVFVPHRGVVAWCVSCRARGGLSSVVGGRVCLRARGGGADCARVLVRLVLAAVAVSRGSPSTSGARLRQPWGLR